MDRWIEEKCLTDESYFRLLQIYGPKPPERNVSGEEWQTIRLYLCLTFAKSSDTGQPLLQSHNNEFSSSFNGDSSAQTRAQTPSSQTS